MLEYELAAILLDNKSNIQDKVNKSHNVAYNLFPDHIQDIYLDNYSDNVLSIVKREIQDLINLSPEEVSMFVTKEFITMILGKEIFKPIKL